MANNDQAIAMQVEEMLILNRSYQRAITQLNAQIKELEIELAHSISENKKLSDMNERLQIDISFYRRK